MQPCNVQITTRTKGTSSRVNAIGKLQAEKDGFTAFYEQDGDEVFIQVKPDSLFMSRKGETVLNAHFIKGARSAMRVGFQNSEGEIPVFTTDYSVCKANGGYSIVLGYELGEQRFDLKISVLIISEEK